MKKVGWISLLLFGVAMLTFTFSASSAWAGVPCPPGFPPGSRCCGDPAPGFFAGAACLCGDIVITNTVLKAEDKLTNCPAPFALSVLGGVVLDISSKVITCDGSFFTVGIQIAGNGVTIDGGGGIIKSCGSGIKGVTSNSTISGVYVRDNVVNGIVLDPGSNNNTLEGNLCHRNGLDGISVRGNFNTLDQNYCRGNAFDGIDVSGSSNSLNKNQTRNNGFDGILLVGSNNTLNKNLASANSGTGINVVGGSNHFTKNKAQNNGDGIFAPDLTNTTDFLNTATGNTGLQCVIGASFDTVC